MDIHGLHHLVLLVDNIPEDEAYYRELFSMEVVFREVALDGTPGTVPEDIGWDEALLKGATPYMTFLGRDDFFLAVASADRETTNGRVDHVALAVDESVFESITERAEALGCNVEENAPHHRIFQDKLGLEWGLNAKPRPPGQAF